MNVTTNQRRQRSCLQSGTVTNMTAINGHEITQITRLHQLDGTVQTHGVETWAESDAVLSTNTLSRLMVIFHVKANSAVLLQFG